MKITSVGVEAYRLPPSSPWEDATNKVGNLEFVVVTLTTDSGLVGVGFTYTVDIGGSAIKALIEDYLVAIVLGKDPLDYEAIWYSLSRQSRRLGLGVNSMAIAAIDIAIWDFIGKIHDQPLYRLLGGARSVIPAYISEINLGESDTVTELLNRVDSYIEQGYSTVKIKIGKQDFADDLERMRLVQERLGRGGTLLVDLNQKWTAAEAIQHASDLDQLGLGWVEEPINYLDVAGHVDLKRAMRTPIGLGESLYSRQQVLQYLSAGAVDFVQADVAFVGGITEWHKIAHLASAFGKPVAPHFMMELSVHLVCGVQNSYMLENVVGGSLADLGLVEAPVEIRDGHAYPSNRPGHGVVFDPRALKRHLLDRYTIGNVFLGGSK